MRILVCAALLVLAACGQSSAPHVEKAPTATAPAPAPDLHGPLIGVGDNPVWHLVADPAGEVTLTIGDHETHTGHYAEPHANESNGYTMEAGDISVDLEVQPCTAGGIQYPLHAIAQPHRQAAVEGCAYVRWDSKLTSLMPQIDACIAAAPAARMVSYAGAYRGGTLVRFMGEDAQTAVDCTVTGGAASVHPIDSNLHLLGEGEALFLRAPAGPNPGPNPGGECYTAPEVKAADGAVLGWMIDPQGC